MTISVLRGLGSQANKITQGRCWQKNICSFYTGGPQKVSVFSVFFVLGSASVFSPVGKIKARDPTKDEARGVPGGRAGAPPRPQKKDLTGVGPGLRKKKQLGKQHMLAPEAFAKPVKMHAKTWLAPEAFAKPLRSRWENVGARGFVLRGWVGG